MKSFYLLQYLLIIIGFIFQAQGVRKFPDKGQPEHIKEFQKELHAAITGGGLTDVDEDEYVEYCEKYGKINGLRGKGRNKLAEKYKTYEKNKKEIDNLNKNGKSKTSHGRVFKEHFSINKFTDMNVEEKKAFLNAGQTDTDRRRLVTEHCTDLGSDYFAVNNAAGTSTEQLTSSGACGDIKNQGSLGTCWAFSGTGQFQCNYNFGNAIDKVFNEQYTVDCSDNTVGTVQGGGFEYKVSAFAETTGMCDNYNWAYNDAYTTDWNNICNCNGKKVSGYCYEFTYNDPISVMNAAQGNYAWTVGIYLTNDFFSADYTWMGCAGKSIIGGHAMTIVGQWYGDWILVRNSWGSGWGWQGSANYGGGNIWIYKDALENCKMGNRPITMNYAFWEASTAGAKSTLPKKIAPSDKLDNDYNFDDDAKDYYDIKIPDNMLYTVFGIFIGVCCTIFVMKQITAKYYGTDKKHKYVNVAIDATTTDDDDGRNLI